MKNTQRIFFAFLLLLLLSLSAAATVLGQEATSADPSTVTQAAAPGPVPVPPAVSAKSALMINADDGRVLFSQNPDERLPMASTTKMMTALLIVENHRNEMSSIVTCSERAAEIGESSIYLAAGEKLACGDMLRGLLIQSGNDAAIALAEFDAGSVEAFAVKMNQRAAELGMTNTHFTNPHGLDDPDHYTTATDFVKLGSEVMKHPEIRDIVKQQEATIPWSGQPYGRSLVNHNHLLGLDPAINGIKTGFTDEAGQCIVISASENGTDLILAYLGGPSLSQRNDEVMSLVRYGIASYQEKNLIEPGREYAAIDLPFSIGGKMPLVSDGGLTRKMFVGDQVEHRLVLPEDLRLPVHKGDKVGLVEAYEGNKYLGSTYLVATEEVAAPDLRQRFNFYVSSAFDFLLSAVRLG